MKKAEIKIGGHYQVKMNRGHIDTVKVEKIVGKGSATRFHVISEDGETDVLKSCQRFLSESKPESNGQSTPTEEIGIHRRKAASLLESAGLNEAIAVGPHVIVEARAGSGKTTTLVEGLKRLKGIESDITPSPQQAAVWDSMAEGTPPESIAFVAFNKSIATELQSRVPDGCSAMTMHSFGNSAVRERFGRLRIPRQAAWVVRERIAKAMELDIEEVKKKHWDLMEKTRSLVSLCKMNLVDGDSEEALEQMASHYEVDLNGDRQRVFELVPRVLDMCRHPNEDGQMDFDDMIWLPVILSLSVRKFDLLLVDEAQDLNRCQQQLALKAGRRLVLCGDPCQAIYGFAGADSESMNRMEELLGDTAAGVVKLPLNETRRCGKAIVTEAQKIVPEFYAHESNGEGKVSRAKFRGNSRVPFPMPTLKESNGTSVIDDETPVEERSSSDPATWGYSEFVESGDMVLCRVNAPLVSECFRFLKAGRKANIQGRDIGQGLISTIKKLKADDIADLSAKLSDWMHREVEKEQAKRNHSEARIIGIQDRHDCIGYFMEDAETVEDVIAKIEDVFTDDRHGEGIKLSSIHKAKGLESARVFLIEPKGATVPHPMAKSKWQREQEYNLRYVAITRAIEELVFVTEG